MNRYKSDDTCEALGVARALPAPARHLWEKWSSPLAAACHPPSCPAELPLIILINVYVQPQEISWGLRTVCSANWREDCWSEEAEIRPPKSSLHLNTSTKVHFGKKKKHYNVVLPTQIPNSGTLLNPNIMQHFSFDMISK